MRAVYIRYSIFSTIGFVLAFMFYTSVKNSSLSSYDFDFLLEGMGRTIMISAVAIGIGTLLGIICGWVRSEGNKYVGLLIGLNTDILRSVPLIIQLVLFYSLMGILEIDLSIFWVGAIVLSAYTAAYVTETVRAGVEAVPMVTRKAARSLGLTYFQCVRYIIFPLGVRAVFPAWISIVLSVIKDSALVSVIGYLELLKSTEELISKTQEALLLLVGVGLFYFIISYPISLYAARLEKRMKI